MKQKNLLEQPVLIFSGGFILIFCLIGLFNLELLKQIINSGFAWSTKYFGFYWQWLLLLTFIIGLIIAISPAGRVRLGEMERPDISNFRWVAMIMCTLLAGGGVFWAAAEPMAHFLSVPPLFKDIGSGTPEAASLALAQSFLHWGFLAWAILGSLTTIILMYYHYHVKGLPLAPRTLLYPLFKEKAINGPMGWLVDTFCILAVVAGTIGPIGFLGLQGGYGLEVLFGIENGLPSQIILILCLVAIYTISAITGLTRGIQWLSRFNVILAAILLFFILIFGPTSFIFTEFFKGTAVLLTHFFDMSLFSGDQGWLGWWTVFFWGWFLGYGPLMAMFIARISRGRTIREIIVVVSIIAPIATNLWFSILGGSGIFFEIDNPGSVSKAFEGFNLPGALFAITQQLPLGYLLSILFLILTIVFVATTGDSMTYTLSMAIVGHDNPDRKIRIFWGIAMGAVAIILITIGAGGIGALQSFIVITAVPVSIILLPSLFYAPVIAFKLLKEQGK